MERITEEVTRTFLSQASELGRRIVRKFDGVLFLSLVSIDCFIFKIRRKSSDTNFARTNASLADVEASVKQEESSTDASMIQMIDEKRIRFIGQCAGEVPATHTSTKCCTRR